MQDNTYWLGLMTHLQADSVPMKSIECLRDLKLMHEAATIDDIYDAYAQVWLAGLQPSRCCACMLLKLLMLRIPC